MLIKTIEPEHAESTKSPNNHVAPTNNLHIQVFGKAFDHNAILGDICLSLEPGSFTVVTGPSGCGKSTLLKIIAGLDSDYQGFTTNTPQVIGFAFQEPRLLPWRTVRENIALVCQTSSAVNDVLAQMNLRDAAQFYPNQISLGMARRVALARAMVVNPDLLLLDEPFVSLDEPTAEQLRQLLLAYWRRSRATVLMVTHNLNEALQLADKLLVLGGTPTTLKQEFFYHKAQEQRDRGWLDSKSGELERSVHHSDGQFAI